MEERELVDKFEGNKYENDEDDFRRSEHVMKLSTILDESNNILKTDHFM